MKPAVIAAVLALGLIWPTLAAAAAPAQAEAEASLTPQERAEITRMRGVLDSLKPQTGVITIPEADAKLNLGERYYFLDKADSRKVLVDLWRNPPQNAEGVLGMVFPAGETPLSENGWGAVITWAADGYVSDKDAKTTDYDKLLKDMQEAVDSRNESRTEGGFPEMHLVGWAETPTYDALNHSMVWAENIAFVGQSENTLNYDVRVLGRKGVLSLNIVGTMSQLSTIKASAGGVRDIAQFDSGQRYADYKDGDKRAAYGVAGLIAAGLGAAAVKKAGLLAVLLVFLKKGFVFILAGLGAAYAWIKRRVGRKETAQPAAYTQPELDAHPQPEPAAADDGRPPAP